MIWFKMAALLPIAPIFVLSFVPVAKAAQPESQTLELIRNDDRCESRIIPYADWPKVSNPKWNLDLASDSGGRLLYFGADHSDNPAHPQFKEIDERWSDIRPTIAFYEGPDRGVADSREETIRKFGESGCIRFLAKLAGIPVKRLNPPPTEYSDYLLSRFPPDQVSLFLFLGEAARLRERKGTSLDEVEAGVKALMEKSAKIPGSQRLILNMTDLEAAYKRYWKEPQDWRQAPQRWFFPGDDPKETGGIFTNTINRASSEFRDRYMVRVLSEAALRGERVFAVVGRNHVPMQAPALRCLLEGAEKGTHRNSWKHFLDRMAALSRAGQYAEAARAGEAAVKAAEESFGGDDANVASTLDALAVIYFVQGELSEAIPLAQRALSIYESRVGKNAREIVNPAKILGVIYLMKGDLDKGEPLLKRAVKLSRKYFGKRHTETAKQLGNLGALYMAREKPAKAKRLFEQAMSIWGESPDPVYGAMTMVNIAKIHAGNGNTQRADNLFRQALALREQYFGRDHPQTKNIADSYAEFKKKAGIFPRP